LVSLVNGKPLAPHVDMLTPSAWANGGGMPKRELLLIAMAAVLMMSIFLMDVRLPLGVAVSQLYVISWRSGHPLRGYRSSSLRSAQRCRRWTCPSPLTAVTGSAW
jgi:hypothetical protein